MGRGHWQGGLGSGIGTGAHHEVVHWCQHRQQTLCVLPFQLALRQGSSRAGVQGCQLTAQTSNRIVSATTMAGVFTCSASQPIPALANQAGSSCSSSPCATSASRNRSERQKSGQWRRKARTLRTTSSSQK